MVVKKQQIEAIQHSLMVQKVSNEIEPKIDKMLQDKGCCRFDCKFLDAGVISIVMQRYKEAGWTVTRQNGYDQRDGESWDYLVIR